MKQRAYDKSVNLTLSFYENWVLPPHQNRKSLLSLKKEEFRTRKNLLNPISKSKLLEDSTDENRLALE